jgi:23S rRNA pseudouridine1911/1915/1917 synthase
LGMSSRKPRRQHSPTSPRRSEPSRRRQPTGAGPVVTPTILFEDDDLIVTVKPAGLATANVPRGQESLLTWLQNRKAGQKAGERAPGPPVFLGVVSRLDQPVSGVVVVAASRKAAASLSEQFRERTVQKTYHALVEGRFPGPVGGTATWTDLLERPPAGSGDVAEAARPQEAVVEATLLARGVEVSLVQLLPQTGRRHQLRAQLGSRKCPIVGDRLYGSRLPFPQGIALHSSGLALDHPSTGERLTFRADWPSTWRQAARGLVLPAAAASP